MKHLLYRFYSLTIHHVRTNRLLFRILFSFSPTDSKFGNYWDWTTLSLAKILKQYKNQDHAVLDVGTGPYGVLAYYAKLKLRYMTVVGIDHLEILIENAAKQTYHDSVVLFQSDLFSNVSGLFDIVIFNAPYMDNEQGIEIGAIKSGLDEKRWSGGHEGIETIERFLRELPLYLNPGGFALLGVNLFHIKYLVVKKAIDSSSLRIVRLFKNQITRSCVFQLTVIQ